MRKQTKFAVMLASVALLTVSAASIVSAKGWVQQGGNWYYQNADGDFVTEEIQASGNSKFYLGEDGAMVTDYFLESYGSGDNAYYFGSNGAMVTNTWVAIDPSVVSNTGDYIPDAYWYYFQGTGKAVKATSGATNGVRKITIDGKKYLFNENGQMLTGWIDTSGSIVNPDDEEYPYQNALYYAGNDNDGVLHSGWLAYYDSGEAPFDERNVLYFYFNTSNNKKIGNSDETSTYRSSAANNGIEYVKKKINGRTYAFATQTGIMLTEWEGYSASSISTANNPWYFSGEEDGHRVQKGWIFAVPALDIDTDAYLDDEEKYMYFNNNGDIVKNQIKKINGKYYGFDGNGIMKTGLVVYHNGEYGVAFNGDNTSGEELSKAGVYRNSKNQVRRLTYAADHQTIEFDGHPAKIHYFGPDGARRTGSNQIEMADDDYIFASSNTGNYEGLKNKKYYSNGILLKASSDIRYGLYTLSSPSYRSAIDYSTYDLKADGFIVLNTSGAKVTGSNTAKKDADGNYWLINKSDSSYPGDGFVGVWTVQVRYNATDSRYEFKSDFIDTDANGNQTTKSNQWIRFGGSDALGKTCKEKNGSDLGDYAVDLGTNNAYALNFYWNGTALANLS